MTDAQLADAVAQRFLTLRQASGEAHVARESVQRGIRSGAIVAIKKGWTFLVSRESLQAWAKAQSPKRSVEQRAAYLPQSRSAAQSVATLGAITPFGTKAWSLWLATHMGQRKELRRKPAVGPHGRAIFLYWWESAKRGGDGHVTPQHELQAHTQAGVAP